MANPLGKKLLDVSRPARYIGGEYGAVCKPWEEARLRWVLAFPDVYEIGMSHLGLQILYHILNNQEGILADRVFAPWFDMEDLLKKEGQFLWGLESGRALRDFDIIGISIPYELTYTNIVSILKLGGITPIAAERGEGEPLVIGGGCGAFNPEPVADFFNAILLGDGEEAVVEISSEICKNCYLPRRKLLELLSSIEGIYIPAFGTGQKIRRRVVPDINRADLPERTIVPNLQVVHDRVGIEIQRGCTRGCRFCQAGVICRPNRQRGAALIKDCAEKNIDHSGLEECAFLSLSAGDYNGLSDMIVDLDKRFGGKWVHISLPSLRIESLTNGVVKALSRSLKGGFTLAPEAATDRLRRAINKGNTEEDLLESIVRVFSAGWRNLKLYFMIGLPGETAEDIEAISVLVDGARRLGKRYHKYPNITVNVSTFVPKSHTPFQWERQISPEETKEFHNRLRDRVRWAGVKLKLHDPQTSFLEGVFSRGDRRLAKVILNAYEKGCRFDAWDDQLKFDRWMGAFFETDINPAPYLSERNESDSLPWDHLFAELDKNFLVSERRKGKSGEATPDCSRAGCAECGVCDFEKVRPVVMSGACNPNSRVYGLKSIVYSLRSEAVERYRYKIRFSKTGDAVFIGHLDLMNIWRRALRRAGLPLFYSKGFNPRPKMSFAPPLKVGVESDKEWFIITLTEQYATGRMKWALKGALPAGIEVLDIEDLHN